MPVDATLPKLLRRIKDEHPEEIAQFSKDSGGVFRPLTYQELYHQVVTFARGLAGIGVRRGDLVGLISENRQEWLVGDLAVLALGAADVPRGCDATDQEIQYILGFSRCRTVMVEDPTQAERIAAMLPELPELKTLVVIDPSFDSLKAGGGDDPASALLLARDQGRVTLLSYREVMEKGTPDSGDIPDIESEIEAGQENDVSTLIYTSGTTGEPKGVMLTHGNFLHQVRHVPDLIEIGAGDRWLCVLPVWHSFERIMQYVALGYASSLCYSEPKGPIMLADMAAVKPTWMASVPRIWEALMSGVYRSIRSKGGLSWALFRFFVSIGRLHSSAADLVHGRKPAFEKRSRILDWVGGIVPYLLLFPLRGLGNILVFRKIKEKLGGRFVAGISGGGALPEAVDAFFAAAGILLLEGYGLTESAPVLSLRPQRRPVRGTIGPIFPGTEYRIIDEDGAPLPPGSQGVLLARGPQVMTGYYRRPDLTRQVLSEDGWLNTGDLAVATIHGELKIVGRAKDTIVLRGGENVEPLPIEQKLKESPFIETAVAVGQDRKYLAALLVPDFDALERHAEEHGIEYENREALADSPAVMAVMQKEISRLISKENGFKPFERITRFTLLSRGFSPGDELSAKQEIKRHVIAAKYGREIEALYS